MFARQPLKFIGQVAQDHRRGLGSVLGHEAHQEAPTGLLQLRGRLHAGIVRRPAAAVAFEFVVQMSRKAVLVACLAQCSHLLGTTELHTR